MRGIQYLTFVLISQTIIISSALAGVTFIVNEDQDVNASKEHNYENNYEQACKEAGFKVKSSSCTGMQHPGLRCPYSPQYTDECCDSRYVYVVEGGCSSGTVPDTNPNTGRCGGRYRCICDRSVYPKGADRDKCTGKFTYDPVDRCTERYYDGSGVEHEKYYYKRCTCSSSYARCNSTHHLHGIGDGCSDGTFVYYTACACDAGYNKLCLSSGPRDSSDYCRFNGRKYYRICNSEEADNKQDNDTMDSTEQ